MPDLTIDGVLSASTERHMNSMTGKGGVSTILTLDATEARDSLRLSLICAHLDSESDSKRDEDFLKLLRDGTRQKDKFPGPPFDTLWENPQDLLDAEETGADGADAVVILGDLNYRVRYKGSVNAIDI